MILGLLYSPLPAVQWKCSHSLSVYIMVPISSWTGPYNPSVLNGCFFFMASAGVSPCCPSLQPEWHTGPVASSSQSRIETHNHSHSHNHLQIISSSPSTLPVCCLWTWTSQWTLGEHANSTPGPGFKPTTSSPQRKTLHGRAANHCHGHLQRQLAAGSEGHCRQSAAAVGGEHSLLRLV